jgi:hypothetical protein
MTDKPGKTDIAAVTVTHNGDLRDRIAAALWKFAQPDDRFPDPPEVFFGMADAVIRKLGLRQETVGLIHRYVTEWTADDA